jgi:lipopolysaccharide export system protein LptA
MKPLQLSCVALALCTLLRLAPAHAEKADRDKPINFSADNDLAMNYQTRSGSLKGNVVVTQGTITVHADRLDLKQNPDNSLSVTAYGNPVTFREKKDGSDEYYEGFAQRAHYDGTTQLLELFDRALLKQGTDEIRSNYISYNNATGQFHAEGRPDQAGAAGPGARVRGVFQPRAGEATPAAAGTDAKAPAGKAASTNKGAEKSTPLTLKPETTAPAEDRSRAK